MSSGLDRSVAIFLLASTPTLGCGLLAGPAAPVARAPSAPSEQARCKVAASHDNPLVTEWSSSEKANLEGRLGGGAVAVQYSGCAMHLLPACQLTGKYAWRHTTTSRDTVDMRNADELYAKLPLGAAALEGELARTGRIRVETTVSGQLELVQFDTAAVAKNPACSGATHVVGAISVGAFRTQSGEGVRAGGAAEAFGASAGGETRREGEVSRGAGEAESCKLASDEAPHPSCRSPIQVFLRPLPQTLARLAPPGTQKVRFLPPDNDAPWDLVVGDRVLCRTPCERFSDPALPYAFRTKGAFMRPDSVDEVPDLREIATDGPLEVRTRPRDGGGTALGIVATSVGGVAMLVGTALVASGCGGKSTGRCVGGAVALPLGALLVAGGVIKIVNSRSRMEVVPLDESTPLPPSRAEEP